MENQHSGASNKPIDIGALTQFLNNLQSYSTDLVQHLRSGQTLCHYTSLEGALGIIDGGDLWLTNTRFSNDDEEMNYGHRLVDTVLDELEGTASADTARLDFLRRVRMQMKTSRNDQVYICCFCETDNLLSQWRGYADNGGGVSIEFDANGFGAVSGPDSQHGLMRLWKVFYDRKQQRKIIGDCIDYPWPVAGYTERLRFVVDALQFFMPTFKNQDFQEERERRLIFTPNQTGVPKLKFRTKRGLLVPYFSLRELAQPPGGPDPAFKLPIKGLLIGPGPHRALNVESAKMALATHNYLDVPVRASTTPFRG
jgi:hypothetical protein